MSSTLHCEWTLCQSCQEDGSGYIQCFLRLEDTLGGDVSLLVGPVGVDEIRVIGLGSGVNFIVAEDEFQRAALRNFSLKSK